MTSRSIRALWIAALATFVAMPAAPQTGSGKANKRVTVVGRVQFAGSNYFTDPRFAIVDDNSVRLYVTTWAPLEVPPQPPGRDAKKTTKKIATMQDFVGRRMALSGIYRSGVDRPEKAKAVAAPGEDFLEVDSVVDAATGATVYSATLPSEVRPTGPPAGETKTGRVTSGPKAAPRNDTPRVPKVAGPVPTAPPQSARPEM